MLSFLELIAIYKISLKDVFNMDNIEVFEQYCSALDGMKLPRKYRAVIFKANPHFG